MKFYWKKIVKKERNLHHFLAHFLVVFVHHIHWSPFWLWFVPCWPIFVNRWSNNWGCALPGYLEILGGSVAWIANEAIGEAKNIKKKVGEKKEFTRGCTVVVPRIGPWWPESYQTCKFQQRCKVGRFLAGRCRSGCFLVRTRRWWSWGFRPARIGSIGCSRLKWRKKKRKWKNIIFYLGRPTRKNEQSVEGTTWIHLQ